MRGSANGEATQGTPQAELHAAYAEASIMLIEGIMLALLEKNIVSLADLTGIIDTAIETKQRFMKEGEHPHIAAVAAGVLRRVSNSLAASRK